DAKATAARATLRDDDPLAALLDEVRAYVAFNFDRAPNLERLSAGFEKTPAGLQHAGGGLLETGAEPLEVGSAIEIEGDVRAHLVEERGQRIVVSQSGPGRRRFRV